jgi:hypothetical protein
MTLCDRTAQVTAYHRNGVSVPKRDGLRMAGGSEWKRAPICGKPGQAGKAVAVEARQYGGDGGSRPEADTAGTERDGRGRRVGTTEQRGT